MKKLADFKPGDIVILKEFSGSMDLQSRLVEMGFVPNIKIRIVKYAPWKGLIELKIRNYYVTIRKEDAQEITAEAL
jgi:Fe2+ transport system protein FeoA